jgi:hypothetical protein
LVVIAPFSNRYICFIPLSFLPSFFSSSRQKGLYCEFLVPFLLLFLFFFFVMISERAWNSGFFCLFFSVFFLFIIFSCKSLGQLVQVFFVLSIIYVAVEMFHRRDLGLGSSLLFFLSLSLTLFIMFCKSLGLYAMVSFVFLYFLYTGHE